MDNVYNTPDAELVDHQDSNIDIFPRFSAWFVFFIGWLTQNIYDFYWLYSRTKKLNTALPSQKISKAFISTGMGLLVILVALTIFESIQGLSEEITLAYLGIALITLVFYLVWVFKFRNRLGDHFFMGRGNLNPILTLLFHVIYLQYKINQKIDSTDHK